MAHTITIVEPIWPMLQNSKTLTHTLEIIKVPFFLHDPTYVQYTTKTKASKYPFYWLVQLQGIA